jgi:uncharacterized protein DUF533
VAGTGLLSRFFRPAGEAQRDGQATELEAHATGVLPATLEGAAVSRPRAGQGRRQRQLALPRAIVTESLSEKILHGWLHNRHQTLYPLTVNLRTLDPPAAALLAQVMAVALLAGGAPPDAEDIESASSWLGGVGGDQSARAALRAAVEAPPALSALLHGIQQANLAVYAYVVALVAGPSRDPAEALFLDYLAARLGLPADVVRSANRRYRR